MARFDPETGMYGCEFDPKPFKETNQMTDALKPEIQTIIETAAASVPPIAIQFEEVPVIAHERLVPDGYRTEVTELEKYYPTPRRARGVVRPATTDALVDYLDRFGDERTTVWVHPTSGRVEAVLDDHYPRLRGAINIAADGDDPVISDLPEVPGHGDHRAILELQHTPEWLTWTGSDSERFNQTDFAEFIEENGAEIRVPTAAELLELAQTFHAQSSSTFRSAKRLDNGETQLTYVENVDAQAGKNGDIKVPGELELAISPFVGEPPYKVQARFRYRVPSGRLELSYKLNRPDEIVRDALAHVAKRLTETFPNVYVGTPRNPA